MNRKTMNKKRRIKKDKVENRYLKKKNKEGFKKKPISHKKKEEDLKKNEFQI